MATPPEPTGTTLGQWGGLDSLTDMPAPVDDLRAAFDAGPRRRYTNPSRLVQGPDGRLAVWVRFGGAGWDLVWTIRPHPDAHALHTLIPHGRWQDADAPYDPGQALAEVTRILNTAGR